MNFDVIIIGGGAAGLSAGLWCDDLGLKALLLESDEEFGGQLLWTHNPIENHLGSVAKNGRELRDIFLKQIKKRTFTRHLRAKVENIDVEEKKVSLKSGESFSAKVLIVATGVRRRKLGIGGEDDFRDRGMLTSGKRDENLVKNKNVLIVGGGDAALENALILSENASRVFLVHRRDEFLARPEFVEKVLDKPNVEILFETILTKISGTQAIETVETKNTRTGEIQALFVETVLIRIGVEPNTEFLRGKIDLDEKGYIKIDDLCATSGAGVYAIGDAANPLAPTVSGAIGMGATAVKTIFSRLNN